MRQMGKYDQAEILNDLIPLFEPHQFWDSQPVQRSTDKISCEDDAFNKPIEIKQVSDVQQTPYALPAQYEWDNLDLNDDAVANEVYELLV